MLISSCCVVAVLNRKSYFLIIIFFSLSLVAFFKISIFKKCLSSVTELYSGYKELTWILLFLPCSLIPVPLMSLLSVAQQSKRLPVFSLFGYLSHRGKHWYSFNKYFVLYSCWVFLFVVCFWFYCAAWNTMIYSLMKK